MTASFDLLIRALLAVLLALSASCRAAATETLTLAGSTSLQPVAENWADAYRARHPELTIEVQGGGSTAGVRAALNGSAQVGMSSRELTEGERSMSRSVLVARDGIALVVHPSNPLRDVTLAEARAMYAGRARSWRSVHETSRRITLITREEGSGTRAAFEALVMDGERIASSALVSDSTGAVRQMVASDPAAIGYISIGLLDASVRALRLNGVEASEANIDAGRYPLVRPFLFVIAGPRSAPTEAFVAWVTGPQGRAIARRAGLLPPTAGGAHAEL